MLFILCVCVVLWSISLLFALFFFHYLTLFVLIYVFFLRLSIHTHSGLSEHWWTTNFKIVNKNESKNIVSIKVRAVDDENLLEPSSAGSDALFDTIRVARETINLNNNQNNQINTDQEPQASEKAQDQQAAPAENSSALDELTLDSIEDDENRGKRFVISIDKGRKSSKMNPN